MDNLKTIAALLAEVNSYIDINFGTRSASVREGRFYRSVIDAGEIEWIEKVSECPVSTPNWTIYQPRNLVFNI